MKKQGYSFPCSGVTFIATFAVDLLQEVQYPPPILQGLERVETADTDSPLKG